MSHLIKGKPKPRGPSPSPSASHASVTGPGSVPTSKFTPTSARRADTTNTGTTAAAGGSGLSISVPAPVPVTIPPLPRRESTRATDRSDALWAEMQATLEAVELSASGSGSDSSNNAARTRVFGPDHERKLDELRAAQIALAQAWARSEADEAIGAVGSSAGVEAAALSEGRSVVTDGAGGAGGKSTVGTGSAARPGSSGLGGQQDRPGVDSTKVEEETEVDILLARKRREANDRYFQRVNQGVLDVVAKLEDVAIAMRAVEKESKDLWGDGNESEPTSPKD